MHVGLVQEVGCKLELSNKKETLALSETNKMQYFRLQFAFSVKHTLLRWGHLYSETYRSYDKRTTQTAMVTFILHFASNTHITRNFTLNSYSQAQD